MKMTQAIQSAWTWLRSSDLSKIQQALAINNAGIQTILANLDAFKEWTMTAYDDLKAAVTTAVDTMTTASTDMAKAKTEMDAVAAELASMSAATVTDAQLADLSAQLTAASAPLGTSSTAVAASSDALAAADAAHNAVPPTP